jgi:hypothetical protein
MAKPLPRWLAAKIKVLQREKYTAINSLEASMQPGNQSLIY